MTRRAVPLARRVAGQPRIPKRAGGRGCHNPDFLSNPGVGRLGLRFSGDWDDCVDMEAAVFGEDRERASVALDRETHRAHAEAVSP